MPQGAHKQSGKGKQSHAQQSGVRQSSVRQSGIQQSGAQRCGVCGVSIGADDRVKFSFGPNGSRDRLYARVCQFSRAPGCINPRDTLGNISAADCYGNPQEAQAHLHRLRQTFKQLALLPFKG